jgi:hypothetical protein
MEIKREFLSEAYAGSYDVTIVVYNKGSDVLNANIYPITIEIGYTEVDQGGPANDTVPGDGSGIIAGGTGDGTGLEGLPLAEDDDLLDLPDDATNATVTIANQRFVVTNNSTDLQDGTAGLGPDGRNSTSNGTAAGEETSSTFISFSSFQFLRKYSNITIAPVAGESFEQAI